MNFILSILFLVVVFILSNLFTDNYITDTSWNIYEKIMINIFTVFLIILIIYILLARVIQKLLNLPQRLTIKQQTIDEFFTNKPQILHDYHTQMLNNGFLLSETHVYIHKIPTYVDLDQHIDMGFYRNTKYNSLVGIIYHNKDTRVNKTFTCVVFSAYYDHNRSLSITNSITSMAFWNISDDIVILQLPELTTIDELLDAFQQANNQIKTKPRSVVNVIEETHNFHHQSKQVEMIKGYYTQSETGEYIATYKAAFCYLYKTLPILNWIYIYQRKNFIKKWININQEKN